MSLIVRAILLLILTGGVLNAQILKRESRGIQGSSHFVYGDATSYFLQQSIGQESVIGVKQSQQFALRQGFLQPIDPNQLNDNSTRVLNGIIFPNPFNQQVTVRFEDVIYDELQVCLYDLFGRQLVSNSYSPTDELVLSFSYLSRGAYLIKIDMGPKTLIAKLIKD